MEGRTRFNYGMKDSILSIKDVNYMLSIVNSDLSDEEKATKLYSFCNYYTILRNATMYQTLGLDDAEKLEKLKAIYDDYNKRGCFDLARNPYKCTLEEIELRLIKLNKAMEIVNSDINEYNKAEQLLELYQSAEELRKTYALFIKFGKKDARLDTARAALDNYDNIFNTFKTLEDKGVMGNVKYALSIKDYFDNYQYASFAIGHYITSSESYKEREFLNELGIDKETFDFCVSTIEELNIELYKQYEDKKQQNAKIRYMHNVMTITTLAEGINNGILPDGTPFDMLEFLKRVPFKYSKNFMPTITEFMKKNNPNEYNTIMSYIYSNRLHIGNVFSPLDTKALYQTKTTVNGIEITNQDVDTIIDYLKINNIPVISKAYILARTKYLNGEFTTESIREQKQELYQNRGKVKVLIPSSK